MSDTAGDAPMRSARRCTWRATLADVEPLCELIAEFYVTDGHVYDDDRVRGALTTLLESEGGLGIVWLIGAEPGVDGYAIVTWGFSIESGGREALLDEIFVRSRGARLGSTALAEIIDECKLLGAVRMFLESERPNGAVRRFYGRNGFVADDSIWMSRDL